MAENIKNQFIQSQLYNPVFHFSPDQKMPHALTRIPLLNDNEVIGRGEELRELRRLLQDNRKVAVVKGVGGVGKTTLARWYVSRYYQAYQHVAWVEQSGKLLDAIVLGSLPQNLGIESSKDMSPEELCRVVFAKMNALPGTGLLVIDNADDEVQQEPFRSAMPAPPGWHVLLTSRQQLNGFTHFELEVLSLEDARRLFRRFYTKPCTDEDLDPLLEAVGRNTLAVECIAKALQNVAWVKGPRAMLEYLEKRQLDDPTFEVNIETEHANRLGAKPQPDEVRLYRYLNRTFSLQQLTDEERRWLTYFTALPPEYYAVDWLAGLFQLEGKAAADMVNTLNRLADLSWLRRDEQGNYAIHRIVQVLAIYCLSPNQDSLSDLTQGLIRAMRYDITTWNPVALKPYVAPAQAVLRFLAEEHPDTSHLQNNLATALQALGDYAGAKVLLEKAMRSAEKNFGAEHPSTEASYSNLGMVLQDLGDYAGALPLAKKALAIFEKKTAAWASVYSSG